MSADAAHAQTETAAQIVGQGGDCLLCVKGSQPTTHAELKEHLDKIASSQDAHAQSGDKEHGRIEQRRLWVSHAVEALEVRGVWKGLGSVLVVESQRESASDQSQGQQSSVERRYYLCSLGLPSPVTASSKSQSKSKAQPLSGLLQQAAHFLEHTRAHRQIENGLHWRLDVHWGEDACRAWEATRPPTSALCAKWP